MYSKNEKPIIRASIFYYDTKYDPATSQKVLLALEKYGMFPPEKIYAEKLTKQRYVHVDVETKETFIRAYSEKNVFQIDMASGDAKHCTDFWHFNWTFTFYKNSKLAVSNPQFVPWNILTIDSTYGRLRNPHLYNNFIACVEELIYLLNAFYASIDDVDNRVQLANKAREQHFTPARVQHIYWGNYFGPDFCMQFGMDRLEQLPTHLVKKVGPGMAFFLSDNALQFDSFECASNRKKVMRYLKLGN